MEERFQHGADGKRQEDESCSHGCTNAVPGKRRRKLKTGQLTSAAAAATFAGGKQEQELQHHHHHLSGCKPCKNNCNN